MDRFLTRQFECKFCCQIFPPFDIVVVVVGSPVLRSSFIIRRSSNLNTNRVSRVLKIQNRSDSIQLLNCGSVSRAVASDARARRFESSHQQTFRSDI